VTGIKRDSLQTQLLALVRQQHGDDSSVRGLRVMEDGHAGLTYGFELLTGKNAAAQGFVLKLGPPGVVRRGSTDIFRQAGLLKVLHEARLPVPRIAWASADEDTLGAPYIVMEQLAGRTFVVWEPHETFTQDNAEIRELWLQAAAALAGFHQLDWKAHLGNWEAPSSLSEELGRWTRLLRHAPDPSWLEAGQRLSKDLSRLQPDESSVGLVHGDYQPGNVLYERGRLTGIIDWDLACIAPQGIDLGWLLMMSDGEAWAAGWKPKAPINRADLLGAYHHAGGPAHQDLEWYQAFAHFRMGAIACLNVKLHRDGRRPDALWERFVPSIPTLFSRAEALLVQQASFTGQST
tara:strand:- start:2343 stop:3386 length:1044 start_codon:yes stop_codon:yes gene_type:complete